MVLAVVSMSDAAMLQRVIPTHVKVGMLKSAFSYI